MFASMARTFPKHLIGPNETVVFDLNPHWIRLVVLSGPGILLALIGVVASFVAAVEDTGLSMGVAALIALGLCAAGALWSYGQYLVWSHTHFVLTDARVVVRVGVLSKTSTEIPLNRINSVACSQNLLERMIHVGDLFIESASTDGRNVIADVRNPEAVRALIAEHSTQATAMPRLGTTEPAPMSPQQPPSMAPPPTVATSTMPLAGFPGVVPDPTEPGDRTGITEKPIVDQIRELSELCDAGIITDTEFAMKKADLLARM